MRDNKASFFVRKGSLFGLWFSTLCLVFTVWIPGCGSGGGSSQKDAGLEAVTVSDATVSFDRTVETEDLLAGEEKQNQSDSIEGPYVDNFVAPEHVQQMTLICGDGVCDPLMESCGSCPVDCGACPNDPCGDGECSSDSGETCVTCPSDCGICPAECGDGECAQDIEDCSSCQIDCGKCEPTCGDGQCDITESCSACPQDCGPCMPACPDGFCNGGESCSTCPMDCGYCPPTCGDASCNGVENCVSCPEDCGSCAPHCGDKVCGSNEDCRSCPSDCGDCPPTLWFRSDWSEVLDAPIVAGGNLRIRFDWERLGACRATKDGYPAWTILLYYTPDLGQPAQEIALVEHDAQGMSHPKEPVIAVPQDARNLWFWAKNTDVTGCVAWDSDYGRNYLMPVFTKQEVSQQIAWAGWGSGSLDFAYWTEGGPVSKGDVDPVWCFESLWGAEVTTAVRVQVYVPGITDRVYQNWAVTAQVAQTAVTALFETNFKKGGGAPGSMQGKGIMEFEFQADNNFFYRWHFCSFGYVWGTDGPPPEGRYGFRLELKTAYGPSKWVGQLNGSPSQARTLIYAKNPSTGCPLFGANPPPDLCP